MKNLIDVNDLSLETISKLICLAEDMHSSPKAYLDEMKGRILATLFYEPSTRTRLSFEAAMLRMGGSVIGFSEASSSSVSKGETIQDTCKSVSCYADIIAMRSPVEGAQLRASEVLSIPIINAGDGAHQHPTQTLTDLFTIHRELGRLENLKIAFAGDLKYGRTVHSLVEAMSRYEGSSFIFVSPKELALPDYLKLNLSNTSYVEVSSIDEAMAEADIIYMTRVQKERFDNVKDYERLKDCFILNKSNMDKGKSNMAVLHPLPRVNEIAIEIDLDPRAAYFRQMENGMYIRMALIKYMLDEKESCSNEKSYKTIKGECSNPKCIVNFEGIISPERIDKGNGIFVCKYCDK